MYKIIAFISVVIRQFLLPNPFEALDEVFSIPFYGVDIPIPALYINWIAEPILHIITFNVVGIYYRRSDHMPAVGSFLYLFFYSVHVGLIYLAGCFNFEWIAIIAIIVCYICLHIGINNLKNRLIFYR